MDTQLQWETLNLSFLISCTLPLLTNYDTHPKPLEADLAFDRVQHHITRTLPSLDTRE